MIRAVPEKDWQYLRSVQSELLSSLCKKINQKSMEILGSEEMSERDKYKALYQHILDSDEIVAKCFDDWRRSTIDQKVLLLYHNSLLTDEHIEHLSHDTKNLLKSMNLRRESI
jgi:hypothetical protein